MPCRVDDTYMPKEPQPTKAEFDALKKEADKATKLLCAIGKELNDLGKSGEYNGTWTNCADIAKDLFPTLTSKSFEFWIKKHCREDEKRAKKEEIQKKIKDLQKELDGL